MKISHPHHSQPKNSTHKNNPYNHTYKSSCSSLKSKIIPFSPRRNHTNQGIQYDQLNYASFTCKSQKLEDKIKVFEKESIKIQENQKLRNSCYQSFMKKIKKQNLENYQNLPSSFEEIKIDQFSNFFIENDSYEDINFKILPCSNDQLVNMSTQIISKYGMSETCGKYTLNKMIRQISNQYHSVSYHNFAHGFSLMHMFYHLLKLDIKFKSMFSKQEIGFTLIAALAHDIGHKGTNNIFEIKMNTDLSIINDKESVLEKMHVRTFFNLLKNKSIPILDKTKNPQKMKELITQTILSTDVSKHFKNLQKFKALKNHGQFDFTNDEHKNFVLEQAFHACDIGNPCLEFDEYINWAALLSYEFNNQTKLEQENGVQVTQMLRYKGKKGFYEGQIGFISNNQNILDVFVFPLWKELSSIWDGMTIFVKNIENNILKLEQKITNQQN